MTAIRTVRGRTGRPPLPSLRWAMTRPARQGAGLPERDARVRAGGLLQRRHLRHRHDAAGRRPRRARRSPTRRAAATCGTALGDMQSQILIFFISFAVLGVVLAVPPPLLQPPRRPSTARPPRVNLVYLALIAFLPFPSGLLGQYSDNSVAVVVYACWHRRHRHRLGLLMTEIAPRHGLLVTGPTPRRSRWQRILPLRPDGVLPGHDPARVRLPVDRRLLAGSCCVPISVAGPATHARSTSPTFFDAVTRPARRRRPCQHGAMRAKNRWTLARAAIAAALLTSGLGHHRRSRLGGTAAGRRPTPAGASIFTAIAPSRLVDTRVPIGRHAGGHARRQRHDHRADHQPRRHPGQRHRRRAQRHRHQHDRPRLRDRLPGRASRCRWRRTSTPSAPARTSRTS